MPEIKITETEEFVINKDENDTRIDVTLTKRFPSHSRNYFHYLIKNGLVTIDDATIKKQQRPVEGTHVKITFALTQEIKVDPEDIPLDILYEDDDIIVVNKAVGMVIHPASTIHSGTFVNALVHHCQSIKSWGDKLRPGIVHRLDKNTSGVLIAAKNLESHKQLVHTFSERNCEKYYLAICQGNPREGEVSTNIARHPRDRKKMAVCDDDHGKLAITQYKTKAYDSALSVVSVKILTGRTHQIRVHMLHIGHPVLGDETYGTASLNKKHNIHRQMLHAHKLIIPHPKTGEVMTFEAPVPEDMGKFMSKIGQ